MADEKAVDIKPSETAVPNMPPPETPPPAPETADEITAHDRLRAFEDEHLGEDTPRISGKIEKGHGSLFRRDLTDEGRAEHAAIERLIDAEQEVRNATAALDMAERKRAEAAAAADRAADQHSETKERHAEKKRAADEKAKQDAVE